MLRCGSCGVLGGGLVPLIGANGLLLVNRRSETGATLAPTIVDDLAATGRRHPTTEAMRANTPRIVGLIGALHR